jgi:biopolymer transport protein ExbD
MPRRGAVPIRRSVSLTSLIDVVFLLLLFFMLSSTFTRNAEVTLTAAAGGGSSSATPLFLRVSADGLTLNGVPAEIEGLAQDIRALSGVTGPDGAPPVLVSLTPDVRAQRLVDVLARLAGLPVQVLG